LNAKEALLIQLCIMHHMPVLQGFRFPTATNVRQPTAAAAAAAVAAAAAAAPPQDFLLHIDDTAAGWLKLAWSEITQLEPVTPAVGFKFRSVLKANWMPSSASLLQKHWLPHLQGLVRVMGVLLRLQLWLQKLVQQAEVGLPKVYAVIGRR
jgi:hypothetical protein